MISFGLICDKEHEFDGWFSSSEDFEAQVKRKLVACPHCSSLKISKSLMAPRVSTGRQKDKINVAKMDATRREVLGEMKKLREKIIDGSEDVGKEFPEEARKIHYGESEKKSIYGEASREDVESLIDEGVEIAPIPVLPDDAN
ncbi:MAG: DUF1178 family protein [Rhizobiaceae bacterium]